jgi:DNA-binding NarL/FixJ family response regulator
MVVDDHDTVRRGLSVFLRAFDDFELVGMAADGAEAVQLCGELQPDVILMDMKMPVMDGVAATRIIRQEYPHIQIVALTSFNDPETLHTLMELGAAGYMFKNVPADELANTIRLAYQGELSTFS